MKRTSSPKKPGASAPRQEKCPYCAELLDVGTVHICPVGCCYVTMGEGSRKVVCPYCDTSFETGSGHVCPELLKLTDPAQ